MIIRQSDMKTFGKCPLMYRWQHIDKLPRLVSGSLVFGSIIHDVVLWLEVNGDIETAVQRFEYYWINPTALDPEYRIDYYVKGTNWQRFMDKGRGLLRHWWNLIQWDTDLVLAREFEFRVPIGDGHTLHGTIDKLTIRYVPSLEREVVLISDYKTNNKVPTYGYLEEDLQFTAYAYASLQPEFWQQLYPQDPARAEAEYLKHVDYPRRAEWVHLVDAKRMDAGERTERHYNRLHMAVNAMADSIAMRIFVPNISGESCRYCEFRNQCGLPELIEVP